MHLTPEGPFWQQSNGNTDDLKKVFFSSGDKPNENNRFWIIWDLHTQTEILLKLNFPTKFQIQLDQEPGAAKTKHSKAQSQKCLHFSSTLVHPTQRFFDKNVMLQLILALRPNNINSMSHKRDSVKTFQETFLLSFLLSFTTSVFQKNENRMFIL